MRNRASGLLNRQSAFWIVEAVHHFLAGLLDIVCRSVGSYGDSRVANGYMPVDIVGGFENQYFEIVSTLSPKVLGWRACINSHSFRLR